MTIPPKVRIYHTKRRRANAAGQDADAQTARPGGQPDAADTNSTAGNVAGGPANHSLAERIVEVKREELTARQLRLARRIAAMHGIDTESDEEAVVLLRDRGIDPFHRSSLAQLVASAGRDAANPAGASGAASPGNQIAVLRAPATPQRATPIGQIAPAQIPADTKDRDLPSREALTEEKRAAEIYRIQRDIARRRRVRQFWLAFRLALLVVLPTIIAGWYYFRLATPLYETESQFMIQQADTAMVASGNSILSGIQLNPDSVAVQSYLTSKNAMLRLDEEVGFKRAFQDPSLDPLLRLDADATDDAAYKTYKNMVTVGYDPTEGVLNMQVVAPDPVLSEEFSRALIRYAEGMVDDMTSRVRTDQMAGAQQTYTDSETRVREAQAAVQALQQRLGILDPASESGLVMSQITHMQTELTNKELELAQLMSNSNPNASRVAGVRGDIQRLQEMITARRAELTEGADGRDSLAQVTGELRIAEADLQTRQALLASAAEQLEMSRIEANKQVRYLSLSVAPVPPQSATYPKALSNTIVAFLIFMGIYLMLSLTASILREQVST
ncbi:capsule biosynthesis protein [Paracoccus aurantiacus]|uniref:Capsule biosynthesis protein n=1 Tax=Paracoccus aurantiacus TaxID=2599412 RepID=A0A5C6S137_9RHOB|nr:capsule biosynthesis protein [Paracoccus aurantiacus]TXB68557.1 capsule biosynthesis protein [Paracoccus aurantiacus]